MDLPKPKRRWFRFSLRTTFVVVTVLCVWLGYTMSWIRQRREFVAARRDHADIRVFTKKDPSKWAPGGMSLLDEPYAATVHILKSGDVDDPREDVEQVVQKVKSLFPEAQINILRRDKSGAWFIKKLK